MRRRRHELSLAEAATKAAVVADAAAVAVQAAVEAAEVVAQAAARAAARAVAKAEVSRLLLLHPQALPCVRVTGAQQAARTIHGGDREINGTAAGASCGSRHHAPRVGANVALGAQNVICSMK
jgi:hypothetical protein